MEALKIPINLSLCFNQIVEMVRQLHHSEKLKLSEFLKNEALKQTKKNLVLTHLAIEKILAYEWLSNEENEA